MASKRAKSSKRRKDSLRFVLIPPKPTQLLEFSDRLLRKDARARAGADPNLPFSRRAAAALISAVWIAAGIAATAYGVRERSWGPGLLGPALLLYGIAWFRLAYVGRSAGGRLGLNPWRTE